MIPLRLRCEDRARTRRLRHALCVFDVTLRDLSAGGARVVGDGLAFQRRRLFDPARPSHLDGWQGGGP